MREKWRKERGKYKGISAWLWVCLFSFQNYNFHTHTYWVKKNILLSMKGVPFTQRTLRSPLQMYFCTRIQGHIIRQNIELIRFILFDTLEVQPHHLPSIITRYLGSRGQWICFFSYVQPIHSLSVSPSLLPSPEHVVYIPLPWYSRDNNTLPSSWKHKKVGLECISGSQIEVSIFEILDSIPSNRRKKSNRQSMESISLFNAYSMLLCSLMSITKFQSAIWMQEKKSHVR